MAAMLPGVRMNVDPEPGPDRGAFQIGSERYRLEATHYLARHHEKLARKHGNNFFVLLLKVVNSQAYGPDVVELVGDVTRAATSPLPTPAPASRTSHRA
ncbi:hypothetical protein SUDANB174_06248 [Streptomyces sp. enrichment culture]